MAVPDDLWGEGWTPPDRERQRQLYAQGRGMRGSIQGASTSRRTVNDLLLQMRGMLTGDERIERNENRDLWIVPQRLYAWLQARGHDLTGFGVQRVAEEEARAQAKRYEREYREALGRQPSAKTATNIPKNIPEPSPWDVRRIEIDD